MRNISISIIGGTSRQLLIPYFEDGLASGQAGQLIKLTNSNV
jgi:hypothetical protein